MTDRFFPADFEQYLYRLYHNYIQGYRTMVEYISKFLGIAKRNSIHETDSQHVARRNLPIHLSLQKTKRPNLYAKPYGDHYYRCGKLDHKSNDCPNHRQVNLTEVNNDDNKDHGGDEEYEGADFAYEEGDQLINLVLQRGLLAPRQEEWQRHKIFRSFCTINNKVCSLIIDGSSCENLISKKVVDYLKLPTEKHESPYSLRWVKRGLSV
ncbi:unnamed protein product [Prunus armeniaca]